MYNYYKEHKILEDERKKAEQALLEIKMKKNRDKKNKILKENYEKRISNIIFDMLNNPKMIVDYKHPIENTRQDLLEEENGKILGTKGMVFKKFMTERERIDKYIKEHERSHKYYQDLIRKRAESRSRDKDNEPAPLSLSFAKPIDIKRIVQPSMRFKPRTDMERIFDANQYRDLDKSILKKQLKDLDLNTTKTLENESMFKDDNDFDIFDIDLTSDYSKKTTAPRFKVTNFSPQRKKKQNVNKNFRQVMNDLHFKTHFKAMAEFSTSTSHNQITNMKPKVEKDIKPRQSLYKTNTNYYLDTSNNASTYYAQTEGESNFERSYNNAILNTVGKENINEFSTLEYRDYNHGKQQNDTFDIKNPFIEEKKGKTVESVDFDILRKVKAIAFSKDDGFAERKRHGVKFDFKNKKFINNLNKENTDNKDDKQNDNNKANEKDDLVEKITIGSNTYNRTDLDKISKQALLRCNYFHDKNKNNNRSTKPGQGKMAMTQGMTISEFEDKYGFHRLY